MKKVLITGATSFIGQYLLSLLLAEGYSVTACVRQTSKHYNEIVQLAKENSRLIVVELDMENIEKLTDFVPADYDVFYHLAWEGTRLPGRDNEIIQLKNYENTIKALRVSKMLNCKTFIGIGSQAEYGVYSGTVSEQSVPNPITAYGKYKLKSYEEGISFSKSNEMHFIWARVFSLYGVHDYHNSLIMNVFKKLTLNESIPLTECTQVWDYLHVKDAVRAMLMLVENRCESGAYNIASGRSIILKEYIEEMKTLLKSTSQLKYGEIPYKDGVKIELCPNIDKLKKTIDWTNLISFSKGIEEINTYYRGNETVE